MKNNLKTIDNNQNKKLKIWNNKVNLLTKNYKNNHVLFKNYINNRNKN